MEFGVNGFSSVKLMSNRFEESMFRLKEGGAAFFEPMVDWGAKAETIERILKQFGSSGWDRENTLKRLAFLRSIDMDIKGLFVFFEDIENQAEELGKYCKNAGLEYVVLSYAGFSDIDDVYQKIQTMKNVSAILRFYGIQLIMHTHEYEFVTMADKDGIEKYVMDIIIHETNVDELKFEVDTGWLVYAGVEPIKFMKENIDRIAILHFKDLYENYKDLAREEISVSCGEGIVDFKGIWAAIPEYNKSRLTFVIDQDSSRTDIIEDNIKSIQYLSNLMSR